MDASSRSEFNVPDVRSNEMKTEGVVVAKVFERVAVVTPLPCLLALVLYCRRNSVENKKCIASTHTGQQGAS